MSTLKLTATGGGGGTVSLKAPAATTSNAALELTLPVDDGTSGQYLKTDGSGVLSFATVSAGDNTPSWLATSNAAQAVGTGSWVQVTNLGTEKWDTDNAFSSNTFTVPSGEGGKYVLFYGGNMANLDSGEGLYFEVKVDGNNIDWTNTLMRSDSSNRTIYLYRSSIAPLAAGEAVTMAVYHNEGGDQDLPGGDEIIFGGYKLNGV